MLIDLGPCPQCGKNVQEELGRLKPDALVRCPHGCKGFFVIEESDMPAILEQATERGPKGTA